MFAPLLLAGLTVLAAEHRGVPGEDHIVWETTLVLDGGGARISRTRQSIRLDGDVTLEPPLVDDPGIVQRIVIEDPQLRFEPIEELGIRRHIAYSDVEGITHKDRRRCKALLGHLSERPGFHAIYLRASPALIEHGLTGIAVHSDRPRVAVMAVVAGAFIFIILALLACLRWLKEKARLERAEQILAREFRVKAR